VEARGVGPFIDLVATLEAYTKMQQEFLDYTKRWRDWGLKGWKCKIEEEDQDREPGKGKELTVYVGSRILSKGTTPNETRRKVNTTQSQD